MKKILMAAVAVGVLVFGMAGMVTAADIPVLTPGWNLVGLMETTDQPAIDVTELGNVISVWKWATVNGTKTWAVYLPGEYNQGDYAASKGFGQLDTIAPGEGFWVNVPAPKTTTTVNTTTTASTSTTTTLASSVYTNTLGMTFNLLPAGTFTMGSPESELGRISSEGPQHLVTLSQHFYVQTTEVTQGQWKTAMGSNPSYFSSCGDNCPVDHVSWEDVQTFITVLNQLGEGVYRLPTEAEWEYAARAGSITAFANGKITQQYGIDPNLNLMGWYWNNDYLLVKTTHPVASKQANDWGLYDMHGNVWEWVQDWQDLYGGSAITDPQGPASGMSRVLRGGSWAFEPGHCRAATRIGRACK